MERIATDTYSFKDLREGGFAYVDKTAFLLPLVDGSLGKLFFIARPRRFGKSLTVSTLQCLFEGRRELFAGLAIEPKWDWSKQWPVIHLDMGPCQAGSKMELRSFLTSLLRSEANRLGVAFSESALPSISFRCLIEDVVKTTALGKCIVLIDAYDKPFLGHLGKPSIGEVRDELKPFYGVVKYTEDLQRFALITGVSNFSKVSIFSDLNNLNEYSMDARAATLFGYTHEEVRANFPESLKALACALSELQPQEISPLLTQIIVALREDDVNDMLDALSCFFANMPANITLKNEKYYQSLFYAVFILIGARTHAECWTNRGRIDAVVETPCGVYVFEFMLHDTAQAALVQIKEKGYADKYLRAGKKVTLIGAVFDATERNLTDRAIEVVPRSPATIMEVGQQQNDKI